MPPSHKSRIGITALLTLVLAIAIVSGISYEQVERRRDRQRFPQIGRSVDVGGRSLNIYCSGEGSPAVILESDALTPGYSWVIIQREIARFTRACWYDRAGYGWSDPAPAPRTSADSARDLHQILRTTGIAAPYVLVGDGFGGFNVRVYAGLYPADVAGVVLSDPIQEDADRIGMAGRVPFHLGYPPNLVIQAVSGVGLMRLLHQPNGRDAPRTGLTPGEAAILAGLAQEPNIRAAFLAEQAFTSSLGQVRSAGNLGGRPLIVLTSENAYEASSAGQLASLSTHGRDVMVKGIRSKVAFEAPEAVIGAVREIIGRK